VLGRNAASRTPDSAVLHLSGRESVSMNLWAFGHTMLDRVGEAIAAFDPACAPHPELLLPDVICGLVAAGTEVVEVVTIASRCIGITHPDDIALVREEIEAQLAKGHPPEVRPRA